MLAVASVVVFAQVLFRYVLEQPLSWAEEGSRFLFIWVALLGAALAVRNRSHFAIGVIVGHCPKPIQEAVRVLIALLGTYIFGLMVTEGWTLVLLNQNQESPAMGLTMSIPYAVIPISGLLMICFTWSDLILHWRHEDDVDNADALLVD